MHEPVGRVGEWLHRVVNGYYRYHAVPGNSDSLGVFRQRLCRLWAQVLRHRSQKRRLNWDRLNCLFEGWLPYPRTCTLTRAPALTPLIRDKSRMR